MIGTASVSPTLPNMTIKILLADDQPVVLDGLRLGASSNNIDIIGRVGQISDLEEGVRSLRPDVLVTEVRLGGKDVLKALENLVAEFQDLHVVAFSGCLNSTHIARAAALGVNDYVAKTEPIDSLFAAVLVAANGDSAPGTSLMVKTRAKMRRPRQAFDHDVPLTNREMQVLRHISMGLSNREIGKSLEISVETVKEHVQNILRKLDVNDRTQAAVWAVKRGLA